MARLREEAKGKKEMTIPISLPDSLRDFLEEEMQERGHESLDACAAFLLERVRQIKPPRMTLEVDGQTYRLTRLSLTQKPKNRVRCVPLLASWPRRLLYWIEWRSSRLSMGDS
jgi:hypothetical protein